MGHTRTSVKSLTNKIDHVKIDYQVKKTKQRNQIKSMTFFFFKCMNPHAKVLENLANMHTTGTREEN